MGPARLSGIESDVDGVEIYELSTKIDGAAAGFATANWLIARPDALGYLLHT